MSLLNIGERETGKIGQSPRWGGKRCVAEGTRPLSPSRIVRAKGRDTLLEEELKQMTAAVKERGEENFLHFGLERSEAKLGGKGRAVERDLHSHIFDGPKANPKPSPRVRPQLGEATLQKIHGPENHKKEDVAAHMAAADDMLDKMSLPNPPMRKKKSIVGNRQLLSSPVEPAMQVEGFAGMGMRSKLPLKSGIGMHVGDNSAAVKNIPTAGAVNRKHNYNAVTGQALGSPALPDQYVTNTKASFKPY